VLLEIRNLHAAVEGKEILRGIANENAISLIINGFCKEVFKNLPMEFAVEATKLLGVSLEGSIG